MDNCSGLEKKGGGILKLHHHPLLFSLLTVLPFNVQQIPFAPQEEIKKPLLWQRLFYFALRGIYHILSAYRTSAILTVRVLSAVMNVVK